MKRISVFLISALLLALLAIGVAAAECEHNWEEISNTPARCDEEGSIVYKCSLCEKQKIETKEALTTTGTHKWGSTKTTKATCSENGKKERICSRCKASDVLEILPATGHTYTVKTEEVTCEEGGTRISECTKCRIKLTETVEPGCDFVFVSTSATCTEKGESTYKCSRCGAYEHRAEEKLGHDLEKTGGPTCTAKGKYVYACTRCDYTKTDSVASKALGHDIPETGTYSWKTTKTATCEKAGEKRARCSRCLEYVYETIKKLDHEYSSEYYLVKVPTAEESGTYERICEECGDILSKVISKGTTNLSRYTVPDVTFSLASTIVKSGTKVKLECELEDATIYYTVDGKSPTVKASRIEYDGAIEITEAVTIKAYAVYDPDDDVDSSKVVSHMYFVESEDVVVEMSIGDKIAYVDDKEQVLDAVPVIKNDRTMLPIRFIAEALGAEVGWSDKTRTVSIITDKVLIKIVVGEKKAKIDGEEVELDSPAYIDVDNNRTYLPVRFVAEALGATVDWDDETRTVTLKGKKEA